MLQSSSACLINEKENESDNFFLIENIRLVENEIKLLKKIVFLESKLFNLEANKEISSSKISDGTITKKNQFRFQISSQHTETQHSKTNISIAANKHENLNKT